jgi:hypothetical protein
MPSEFARHRLSLLVDDAGLDLPLSHWPLPRDAVANALQKLPPDLPEPLQAARDAVEAELRQDGAGEAQVTLRTPAETLAGFGEDTTPGSSIGLRSPTYSSEWVAARAGARAERASSTQSAVANVRAEGSALATEALGVQLQAWSNKKWWGAGWESSLILGNNAPALTGLGLQRASASTSDTRWLSWLGPWNYEFFMAQLDGVKVPAHPTLIGMRLTLRPFDHLEIGISRTAQWGGQGRPNTLTSFLHMLTGKGDNADTLQNLIDDPANEMAGYDLRLRCPLGLRCAAYVQAIGEDEAGHLPSRMLGLYGMEAWSADGRYRWIAELAETGCRMPVGRAPMIGCAYRNHAYPEGYAQQQRWLGAAVGPDSRLLTLGWIDGHSNTSVRFHYGNVASNIGTFEPLGDSRRAGRLVGLVGRTALTWNRFTVEPTIGWLRVRTSNNGVLGDASIGVTLRTSLDAIH